MRGRTWLDPSLPLEDRVAALVADLTAEDRSGIALGEFDSLVARGVPAPDYVDAGTGLRGVPGATAFPAGIALAATFDPELAADYGSAVADEARAAGFTVLLGPTLDLARDPRAGRIPEALGEDPHLSGLIGAAHVHGAQSRHVICQVKHFVAYNGEDRRTGYGLGTDRGDAVDVRVSAAVLHDAYLRPFRAAVEAGAWSLMSSYNRVNGSYPAEDSDLLAIPRTDWGWRGFSCPDFLFAVRDPGRALGAGLDLGALGGPGGRTRQLLAAAGPGVVDGLVANLVRALIGSGLLDDPPPARPSLPPPSPKTHRRLAERCAIGASVLLRNDRATLPLGPEVRSVAVIGPSGEDAIFVVGGSAAVDPGPGRLVTPLEGIRAAAGGRVVEVAQGSRGDVPLPLVPPEVFALPDGSRPGVRVEFVDEEAGAWTEEAAAIDHAVDPEHPLARWPRRWTARLTPRRTGRHRLSLSLGGRATVRIDGRTVMTGSREAARFIQGPHCPLQAVVDLVAGEPVLLDLDYEPGPSIVIPPMGLGPEVRLGWQEPDDLLVAAAATAAGCDAAVVLVNMASGEGMDRDTLALPGDQDALVHAVAAANPRTVVVLNTPGAVLLPWLDEVGAVLQVWYPGERFGAALGAMLFGAAEPGGRLPLTFPRAREDLPGGDHGPEVVSMTLDYDADGGIGYRAPGVRERGCVFAFGHGLAYASSTCEVGAVGVDDGEAVLDLVASHRSGGDTVHVAQVYASVAGAAPELVAVARLPLRVGAGAAARVRLRADAFARW
ncbi:glycoside hydrolase family 3 protein, partial [Propionicimonas sp.]|uniref:glycoside hydrolase family 3 protein n=1 Tax=Propionicimonas sp. TaxID=1955623 RepID=UPI0039E36DAB